MEEDNGEEPELGPDGDLVSAMVSTAVVPSLCKVFRNGVFDPYSVKHTKRLVDLAEQVELYANKDKFEVRRPLSFFFFKKKILTW